MSFKRRSLAITCAITSSIAIAGISGTAAAQSSYVSGSSGLFSSSSDTDPETPAPLDAPKNIIYMIGDGMGYNHVAATNLYETGQTMYQVEGEPGSVTPVEGGTPVQAFEGAGGPSLHSPPSRMETPTTLSARGLITTMSMRTSPTPPLQVLRWQLV